MRSQDGGDNDTYITVITEGSREERGGKHGFECGSYLCGTSPLSSKRPPTSRMRATCSCLPPRPSSVPSSTPSLPPSIISLSPRLRRQMPWYCTPGRHAPRKNARLVSTKQGGRKGSTSSRSVKSWGASDSASAFKRFAMVLGGMRCTFLNIATTASQKRRLSRPCRPSNSSLNPPLPRPTKATTDRGPGSPFLASTSPVLSMRVSSRSRTCRGRSCAHGSTLGTRGCGRCSS